MEKKKHIKESSSKIDWKSLQNMKVNDIKGYLDDDFNPDNLLCEEDEEDTVYLQQWNTNKYNKEMSLEDIEKRNKDISNYGVHRQLSINRLDEYNGSTASIRLYNQPIHHTYKDITINTRKRAYDINKQDNMRYDHYLSNNI